MKNKLLRVFATAILLQSSAYCSAEDIDGALVAFNKSMALVEANNTEQAIPLLDAFVRTYVKSKDIETQRLVVEAMYTEAEGLALRLDKPQDALEIYDQLINQFDGISDDTIQRYVLLATAGKGGWFLKAGHANMAIPFLNKVIANGHLLETPDFQRVLAKSYVDKETSLILMKNYEEALALNDEAMKRLEASPDTPQYYIAFLFNNLSRIYNETNRPSQAVATVNEAVRRFGNSAAPNIQQLIVLMQFNEGVILMDQLKWEDARDTFASILTHFESSQEADIQRHLVGAMIGVGYSSTEMGNDHARYKRTSSATNSYQEAIASLDKAIQRFGENQQLEIRRMVIKAYFNKTTPLVALSRSKEAIANIDLAISKFSPAHDSEIDQYVSIMKKDRANISHVLMNDKVEN